jgi:SAM-dependent MidA family methyltransferase
MGTLMCHYRHHAHGDPFLWPGLQDITTHVDFSAVAHCALAQGLQPLGFVNQARLLTSLGLLERLVPPAPATGAMDGPVATPAEAAERQLAWARLAQSVQVLLSEAEMGELFKAVAFGRGVDTEAMGFERGDRMATLVAS